MSFGVCGAVDLRWSSRRIGHGGWMGGVVLGDADRLPVVVRFPAGPRVSLKWWPAETQRAPAKKKNGGWMGEQETSHELNFPVQFDSAWQVRQSLWRTAIHEPGSKQSGLLFLCYSIPPQISLLGVKFWKISGSWTSSIVFRLDKRPRRAIWRWTEKKKVEHSPFAFEIQGHCVNMCRWSNCL